MTQKQKLLNSIYSLILLIVTSIIWCLIYQAQFLVYDDNWGNLILAFIISVCSFFLLIFVWSNWKEIILNCKWQTILFLLFASPLSVVGIVFNYELFFGTTLNV
ncbi:hypothetical protein D3C86_1736970 [compost metagenome]